MRAEDVLPDDVNQAEYRGITIRKGSVAAFLANAAAFGDPAVRGTARAAVLRDIETALPALRAVGLFEVLEIRDPVLRAFVETRM